MDATLSLLILTLAPAPRPVEMPTGSLCCVLGLPGNGTHWLFSYPSALVALAVRERSIFFFWGLLVTRLAPLGWVWAPRSREWLR